MSIKENYDKIIKSIKNQARLIAVVKGQSQEDLEDLYEAGQRIFAENKVQDLLDKSESFADKKIIWHFIGHLQRNKVKYIIDKVELIHSLDSRRLAEEVSKRALAGGKVMDCLVQVNTGQEDQKYGIDFSEVESFLASIEDLPGIKILGLMAVTPFCQDPEDARKYFKEMYNLFEKLKKQKYNNADLQHLSMGMSNDYLIALEEGADMVRIGSLLFN